MTLLDIINATKSDFTIIVTRKDGTTGDSVIFHCMDRAKEAVAALKQAKAIASRKDLALESITCNNGQILFSLKEI